MWGTKAYLHSCNAYNLVTACHEREKELSPSLNRQFWFSSSLSLFPQPATAPALPVGVPRYPSVPCVQMGSFSTRASVWRPVGRDSTPRTTPATVRACIWVCLKFYMPVKHASRPWQSALLTFCPPLLSDCHPSCRSCVGPLASDCLRCLKPEEALLPQSSHLQHGVCTAGCPAHSFPDDMQTCRGES